MDLKELVQKNRTYRRFYEEVGIPDSDLRDMIDLARLSASGSNKQALKYFLVTSPEGKSRVFDNIHWAAYLKDWAGPGEGERPSSYIIMVLDRSIAGQCYWDHGIAAQSILLGATEKGYGGCMFASFNASRLSAALEIPAEYQMLMVIALGKPKEVVVIEAVKDAASTEYYRDEAGIHHVPKRSLEELIVKTI